MVKIIMHGCNGHMGQVITGLVKEDANAEIIAGIDMNDNGQNDYPVFKSLAECDVPADVVVDFSSYKIKMQRNLTVTANRFHKCLASGYAVIQVH